MFYFILFFVALHQSILEPPLPLYLPVKRQNFLFSPSVLLFACILFSFIFRPYFAFPFPLLCSSLLLSFFYSLPFFFNLNTLKPYLSKRASLNNIVSTFMLYTRPAFIPGLFYFTYFPLFFFHIHTAVFPSCVATSPLKYLISLSLLNENQT